MPQTKAPFSAPSHSFAKAPGSATRTFGRRALLLLMGLMLIAVLSLDGLRYLGSLIPFSIEREMALPYGAQLPQPDALAIELDRFAQKIAVTQEIPPEIHIEVRVIDQDRLQAFGTLGGYVVVYKSLLKALKSEEELAALLAHQIAHIAGRHPTEALGRRVNAGLLLSIVSQEFAAKIAQPSFGGGLRTAPRFSRDHEEAATAAASESLVILHGHLGGAADLSATLRRMIAAHPAKPPELVATHPGMESMVDQLGRIAAERNWNLDSPDGRRRALPLWLSQALNQAAVPAEPDASAAQPSPVMVTPPSPAQ